MPMALPPGIGLTLGPGRLVIARGVVALSVSALDELFRMVTVRA